MNLIIGLYTGYKRVINRAGLPTGRSPQRGAENGPSPSCDDPPNRPLFGGVARGPFLRTSSPARVTSARAMSEREGGRVDVRAERGDRNRGVLYALDYFAGVLDLFLRRGGLGEREELEDVPWVEVREGTPPVPGFDRWAMSKGLRDWGREDAAAASRVLKDAGAVLREHRPAELSILAFEDLMGAWQADSLEGLRAACARIGGEARRGREGRS